MAVRRIGSVRLPDQSKTWDVASPNHISPGDVLFESPDYGGQSMREAPGPFVTEEQMVAREPDVGPTRAKHPKQAQTPKKPKRPRVRAVLPPEAKLEVMVASKDGANRTAINLRMPNKLLDHYKTGGRGYQSRMIAVLEMFIEQGGKFIEV